MSAWCHYSLVFRALINSVKLARAELTAKASGKLIRRWEYLRMHARISAGNYCLGFPRVTGRNLASAAGNSQTWICSKKFGLFLAGSSNRYPKKQFAQKVFTAFKKLAVVTFSVFSLILSEGNITSKSRSWSWIPLKTKCVFDEHYWFFCERKHRSIGKTENALVLVGESFLTLSKSQFPRERLNK